MDNTDLLTQTFQYLLGVIPGDIASNIIAVVATIVTVCTLIIRFWKEPDPSSKIYKIWKLIHILASFQTPTIPKKDNKGASKTN